MREVRRLKLEGAKDPQDRVWHTVTSPDIRGLILSYTSLETSKRIISPVIQALIWGNEKTLIYPPQVDWTALESKKECEVRLVKKPFALQEPTPKSLGISQEDGTFFVHNNRFGNVIFIPKEHIDGVVVVSGPAVDFAKKHALS